MIVFDNRVAVPHTPDNKYVKAVNKFGRNDEMSTSQEDIWMAGGAVLQQPEHLPIPTAQVVQINSQSALDTELGDYARAVDVTGLPDWDSEEITETVLLDGINRVDTVNAFVMINRMRVSSVGDLGYNVGTIICAVNLISVQAVIDPTRMQTEQAIYGIPSTQVGYMTNVWANIANTANQARSAQMELVSAENGLYLGAGLGYTNKHTFEITTTGTSTMQHNYNPYKRFDGPCLIKLRGTASANGVEVSGGFDIALMFKDNSYNRLR